MSDAVWITLIICATLLIIVALAIIFGDKRDKGEDDEK